MLMCSMDYAEKLNEEFGVDPGEALEAIDHEVKDLQSSELVRDGTEPRYAALLARASENIRKWLIDGATMPLPETYEDIGKFCSTHRRACSWAVLTAKAKSKVTV